MKAALRLTKLVVLCAALASLFSAGGAHAAGLRFRVTLDPKVSQQPVTGRLFVFLSQRGRSEPRLGPDWFHPEPFFGVEVKDFQPGESRVLDDSADGFPDKLSQLPAGRYRAQALLDHDFYHQNHAYGVGNFYSDVANLELDGARGPEVVFHLDQTVKPQAFAETKWVREVKYKSKLLSDFHGRDVWDRCAVTLPASYFEQPARRYPVIYSIPGFSGSHRQALRGGGQPVPAKSGEVEFIRVSLSGQCKWGHHVYADSATNGPRGEALVQELIPLIDEQFRTVGKPYARFLYGHSSGGWSSLWLQVTYPDVFGGVWSTSPDPVDFRDYQQVNLYAQPPLSLYYDESGQRRPIARRQGQPVLWYDSFGKMDDCLGRGGQLRSFEAVFSPLGKDGQPQKLWDRKTGRINPEVAKAWQAYDINLKLKRNWRELGPKLAGKLHITTGSLDTFYLEGAVALLAETLKGLGSDADVVILPGEDHGSLLRPALYTKIRREMGAAFQRGQQADATAAGKD